MFESERCFLRTHGIESSRCQTRIYSSVTTVPYLDLVGDLDVHTKFTDKIKVRYCGDARVDPGLAPAGFDTMRSQEAAFRFKHSSVQAHDRLLHLLHALKLTVRSTFVKIASAGQLANQGGRGGALEGYKCRQI